MLRWRRSLHNGRLTLLVKMLLRDLRRMETVIHCGTEGGLMFLGPGVF